MNGKLHAFIDFVCAHALSLAGLLVPAVAHQAAKYFLSKTTTKEIEMEIINKEVADGIKLEIQIVAGELKVGASVGLAYLCQKLDDKSDNVIVSALAQMAKALAEKA